jgi:hypothetical protein
MNRKDFVAIAAVFAAAQAKVADMRGTYTLDTLAVDMANLFRNENPRFDRDRFLAACKGGK